MAAGKVQAAKVLKLCRYGIMQQLISETELNRDSKLVIRLNKRHQTIIALHAGLNISQAVAMYFARFLGGGLRNKGCLFHIAAYDSSDAGGLKWLCLLLP